jgi:hypothetical protein
MRMFRFIGLLVLAGGSFSCSDDDAQSSDLTTVDLSLGSEYRYDYIVREDSSGIIREVYRDTFAVRVEAIGETVGGESGLTRIRSYDVGAESLYAMTWYRNSSVELSEIAYMHAGMVPLIMPKRNRSLLSPDLHPSVRGLNILNGRLDIETDTLMRDNRRIVYQYPLTPGRSWTSFISPFLQSRSVDGRETVVVPAGRFECTVIATTIPHLSPYFQFKDYVTARGLIRRTISDSVTVTSQDAPDGTGWKLWISFDLRLISSIP